jgi:hypothetical protein
MTFSTLIAVAAVFCLLSCSLSLLAIYWSIRAGSQRGRAALICSGVALLVGYWGLKRIHLSASKTVNGHLVWSLNSHWFFIAALVLGAVSLAFGVYNWRQTRGSNRAAYHETVLKSADCKGDTDYERDL